MTERVAKLLGNRMGVGCDQVDGVECAELGGIRITLEERAAQIAAKLAAGVHLPQPAALQNSGRRRTPPETGAARPNRLGEGWQLN